MKGKNHRENNVLMRNCTLGLPVVTVIWFHNDAHVKDLFFSLCHVMSLDFKIKWNGISQVGRTETRLGLLESARNSILLATVLYLMNYSSVSMFPDVSPFSRLLLGHPELHRSHTESRVSLHAFPVMCCWVEWMNAEKAAWNSFTVCNGFWFMMSWRATSGNYTCISPHSAGNSSSLALRAPVTAVSLSCNCRN